MQQQLASRACRLQADTEHIRLVQRRINSRPRVCIPPHGFII
jgi:hypothetical protein